MKRILFFLSIILLSACTKDAQRLKGYPELVGDFDWTHSHIDLTTLYSKENSSYTYGIRIKKSGKAMIYSHGKLVIKGTVVSVEDALFSESPGLTVSIRLDKDVTERFFYDHEQEQLVSEGYPFTAIRNTFQKK